MARFAVLIRDAMIQSVRVFKQTIGGMNVLYVQNKLLSGTLKRLLNLVKMKKKTD